MDKIKIETTKNVTCKECGKEIEFEPIFLTIYTTFVPIVFFALALFFGFIFREKIGFLWSAGISIIIAFIAQILIFLDISPIKIKK